MPLKEDWKLNDTVMPEDMNAIGKEVNSNKIIVQDTQPTTGSVWFETGIGGIPTPSSYSDIVIKNAVAQDETPENKEVFWFDL